MATEIEAARNGEDAIEIAGDVDDHLLRVSVATADEPLAAENRRGRRGDARTPDMTAAPRAQPSVASGSSTPPPSSGSR
jgi:hypothetical protein